MASTSRSLILRASILGTLVIGLGAFGAHGLKDVIAKVAEGKAYWETAAHYALPHAAALVALAAFAKNGQQTGLLRITGHCWFIGSLIFSGTLMAMALGAPKWLGAITPIGGTALIAGWFILGVSSFKRPSA